MQINLEGYDKTIDIWKFSYARCLNTVIFSLFLLKQDTFVCH
jgi:hypothetical protein